MAQAIETTSCLPGAGSSQSHALHGIITEESAILAADDEFSEGSQVAIRETFKHGPFSTRLTIYGTRDQPLFRLREVEQLLGKTNLLPTVKHFDNDEKVRKIVSTPGGNQEVIFLTEDGIISLMHIVRSSAIAKAFRRWVSQVVKKIMLEGRYEVPAASEKLIQDAETARLAADEARLAAEREAAEMKRQLEKKNQECEKLKREAGNKHHRGHCIYLLRNPADRSRNLTKIGRTQDLSMRETSYHTGMPDGVDILHCCHTSDSKLAEQLVHHALKEYRYDDNREWFQGDPELFAHTIDFVTSVVDNLPLLIKNMVSSRVRDRVRIWCGREHHRERDCQESRPGGCAALHR
jgi:prophage antirepressor-like protein